MRIDRSRGIRLPRRLIEQAGLGDEVVIRVSPGRIVIESLRRPREGWEEEAMAMRAVGEDQILAATAPTEFDRNEWEWK